MKKRRPILNPPAIPRWGISAIKKIPYRLRYRDGEVIYAMVAEQRRTLARSNPPVLAGGTPTPGPLRRWRRAGALAGGGLAAAGPVLFSRLAGGGPAGVLPTIKTIEKRVKIIVILNFAISSYYQKRL